MQRFQANLSSLTYVIGYVKDNLRHLGKREILHHQITLAVEEAFVNIVKHGYKGRDGIVDLEIQLEPHKVLFILLDEAPAFNPLTVEMPFNPHAPLHEQKEGGQGIRMIKKIMDTCEWRYESGRNVLTLTKFY